MRRAFSAALMVAYGCSQGLALADVPTDSAASQAIVERSRKLFAEGISLYKQGDYARAYTVWLLAYKTRPHYTVAANLGRAELKLQKYRDAAEHLAYAVRTYAPEYADERRAAENDLTEAKRNIATVVVQTNKSDAAILLDDQVIAHAPVRDELFIDPGVRTFQARLGAVSSDALTAPFPKGSTTQVELNILDPAPFITTRVTTPPPPPAEIPAAPRSISEPGKPTGTYVVVVGGALTLVGAGIGTGFMLRRASVTAEADRLQDRVTSCADRLTPDCSALAERRQAADDARKVATVAFIGAGAVAVLSLGVWALLPTSTHRVTLGFGPANQGTGFHLQVRGAF
jgi:hypothetical protein